MDCSGVPEEPWLPEAVLLSELLLCALTLPLLLLLSEIEEEPLLLRVPLAEALLLLPPLRLPAALEEAQLEALALLLPERPEEALLPPEEDALGEVAALRDGRGLGQALALRLPLRLLLWLAL